MHLELGFCKHYCVQMKFSFPCTIGKCSWGKEHPFLTEYVLNYEHLYPPVQGTACRLCRCSRRDKLVLPEVTGILSNLDQLPHLWGMNCFGNGTRQYSTCRYQSGSSHIFFYHFILSILGKILLLRNKFFQCLAIVAFQLQSGQVLREKFLEL